MKAAGSYKPFNSFYSTHKSSNKSRDRNLFSNDEMRRVKGQKIAGYVINNEGIIMNHHESNPNKKLV